MRKRARTITDELSVYEQGSPASASSDTLEWWKLYAGEFPATTRMSIDMLAIPATISDVERIFSLAKLMIIDRRSSIDSEAAGKIAS
jgi:hypothetical protein